MKLIKRVQVSAGASHWEFCGAELWLWAALQNFYPRIPAGHEAAAFWAAMLPFWIFITMEFHTENGWDVLNWAGSTPPAHPWHCWVKFTCRNFLSQTIWIKAQQTPGDGDFGGFYTNLFSLCLIKTNPASPLPGKPATWNHNSCLTGKIPEKSQRNPQFGAVGSRKRPQVSVRGRAKEEIQQRGCP